ncbi:hypothetical protein V8E54_009047 [Elaphomyces granulatus]
MLTSLAPETLCLILDRLPNEALLSLRAMCKAFLHAITPRVFSDVSFSTHNQLQCLQALLNPSCTIAPYVISLHIASGNVSVNSLIPTTLPQYSPLSRMRNLKTVHWTHSVDRDASDYLMSTAGALSSLPSLKTLMIKIETERSSPEILLPPLRDFKNLCTLSVSCDSDISREYCLQIATVIDASPGLANLSICADTANLSAGTDTKVTVECTLLQYFLQKSKPELAQLELKRQLSISTRPGGRHIEFDWGQLWSALRETGIELSILEVSGTENAIDNMFTYLLSYTGLQRLAIRGLRMDTQEMEDKAAQRFWYKIIPHHRDSLTTLFVNSKYEGEWCFGPRAAPALRKCSSLRDLTISMCSVNVSWAKATLSRARKYNNIEFNDLQEPDGAVENCGVDTNVPLEKLRLLATNPATHRAKDIDHLNRNARIKCSAYDVDHCAHTILEWRRKLRTRISQVLLGIRAPAATSTNWPLIVETDVYSMPAGEVF